MSANKETLDSTIEIIRIIVAEILGKEAYDIGIKDNLFDAGMDSLSIIKLMIKIEEKMSINGQLDLVVEEVFENPNIAGIANYLLSEISNNV